MKSLDTLVSDIHHLLEGKALADPSVVAKFGAQIGEVLVKRLSTKDDRKPLLRMSNLGKPLRQLWYELNGYKGEELTGKTLLKFTYGDLTEALVICLAEAAGHTVERLQEEVEYDGVPGHIDCVIDGVLVDVKSCSSYSYMKFDTKAIFEPGNDPFGYVGQLKGYSTVLELPAAWVYFDKVHGDLGVLRLPEENPYDVRSRIATVNEAVARTSPPARCYEDEPDGKSGNRKLSLGCSYCSFKNTCWEDANEGAGLRVYLYSTGPRYLTNVAREPKVFQTKQEEQ